MPSWSGRTSPSSSMPPQQRIAGPRDGSQRPGAIDHIGEARLARSATVPRRRYGDRRARRRPRRLTAIRPATISSRPSATISCSCRATSGAIRWRWTSHHGRAWRRKRRCCAGVAGPATARWLCGRSESTAARQPTSRAAPPKPAPQRRHIALRNVSASTGAGVEIAHAPRGISPRRDSADDPPAMAGGVERQHRVDHRQAGADQQHVAAARRERRATAACASVAPRIVDRSARRPRPNGSGSGGWLPIASTSALASIVLAVRRAATRQPPSPSGSPRPPVARPASTWPDRHRLVEDLPQIAPELPPLGEAARVAALARDADEMRRGRRPRRSSPRRGR